MEPYDDWLTPHELPPSTDGLGTGCAVGSDVVAEMERELRRVGIAFAELQAAWTQPDVYHPSTAHPAPADRQAFAWQLSTLLKSAHDWKRQAHDCAIAWHRIRDQAHAAAFPDTSTGDHPACGTTGPAATGTAATVEHGGYNDDDDDDYVPDGADVQISVAVRDLGGRRKRELELQLQVLRRRVSVRCASIAARIADAMPQARTAHDLLTAADMLAFRGAISAAREHDQLGRFVDEVARYGL